MNFEDNSCILITGGTGSIGNSLVAELINNHSIRKIVIFSRDELKQFQMREKYKNSEKLRWFLGDVRDSERLRRAFNGIDYVVHAAALKQVDAGEYNPIEFVRTNVEGSINVIDAAIDAKVRKIVALSTDKASSPINLYGATKLTADKLFINANNYGASNGTYFSVVRYGNVMGSRGSVIPFWRELSNKGLELPITDVRMTRFWITLKQATNFILDSFEMMNGGELYVPRIPSFKLVDLIRAIDPNAKLKEIGIRPGEKLHEEMISEDDTRRTTVQHDRFVVSPMQADWNYKSPVGEKYPDGHAYKSNTNDTWLTVDDMKSMILNERH